MSKKNTIVVVGFDISLSVIAGAACLYSLESHTIVSKPILYEKRFYAKDEYFERLKAAGNASDIVYELAAQLTTSVKGCIVAVEEPWPVGIIKKGNSSWIRQQAEMVGSASGSLLNGGFDLMEVNQSHWKKAVALDLDIKMNKEFTKFTIKEWGIKKFGLPEIPDLIKSKDGYKPKPETSIAKPAQPDDRYDAVGIMYYATSQIDI